jgi:ferredoxin-NADP reductase/predicted pyridoxine 5'-phosphate oxidase superfamily flavin-nucleotide-binding protein
MEQTMTDTTQPSPFHRGEQAAQQRLGVREQMERFGSRVIRDHMPDQHREFYRQLPFVLVGHADEAGWPWASILFNQPGFITSNDAKTLDIDALPVTGDPLADALQVGTRLGLLGIDLPTRRRNRLATHIVAGADKRIRLAVDQAFGNCPQYIQTRDLEQVDASAMPGTRVDDIVELDSRSRALIQQSDTFFVASYVNTGSGEASEGADVSHRGGRPGFIRIDGANTLTIPDYLGNNHFNTFGNFIENPRAGLLFVDFEQGHLLTLTGTVEILWDAPEAEHFEGARQLWKFHVDHGRWINDALPLRWKLEEFSPNTMLSGTWDEAAQLREADAHRNQWSDYTVTKVIAESSVIKSIYLEPREHAVPKFKSGQFLTVKIPIAGRDTIRTYTVSSAPADATVRISVKRERAREEGLPDGLCSSFIHDQLKVGEIIQAKAPCGAFTFDAAEQRPAVLVAGGVGITPMVSMARHALVEGVRTRYIRPTTLISSASNGEQRAFFDELNEITLQSAGSIRSFWALSQVDSGMEPGKDYHQHGRISAQFLQAVLPLDDYDFYLCGPGAFMQAVYDMLRALGVNNARIFAEEFGPASLQRDADLATMEFKPLAAASEAIVSFTDSQVEQAWSNDDGSLLDFAEAHGFSPEFGCRSGQCGACKTRLVAGAVVYQTEPSSSLEEDEILLCCAVPAEVAGEDVVRLAIKL